MTYCTNCVDTIRRLSIIFIAPFLISVSLFSGAAIAEEHQISDKYSMVVDPAAKQQLGEKTYNETMMFFHAAEKAIETKDLAGLMALYSDSYSDGVHDKKSAEQIWQRMFNTFDSMATQHSLKLGKVSADKNMVIFQCSGLLMGSPDPKIKKGLITIDNWANQDHVLVKEGGKWKLIGTYGLERKRFWFDQPMHPLF